LNQLFVGAHRAFVAPRLLYTHTEQLRSLLTCPPLAKTEWLNLWRQRLDDHETHMAYPEAHRDCCLAISKDMLEAKIIDQVEQLTDEGKREHDGFVIITADAQGGMVYIHDRRPVVLASELTREWLDLATPKERAEQMVLSQGEPSEAFEWFRVSAAVGNVRNQGAHLIEKNNDLTTWLPPDSFVQSIANSIKNRKRPR
jgi:putative SOS response-associated peptidase YedK